MEINDLKARIKSGDVSGTYIFAGEEDYLKKYYLGELKGKVIEDDTLATFNHALFEGSEVNFAQIRDAIESPPVFAERKLIEWRYPSFEKMKDGELQLLEQTAELVGDYGYVTLVFLVSDGEVDLSVGKKESKFERRFKEKIGILNFKKSTDAQLVSWLKRHLDSYGISADADTLGEVVFRAGHSMSVLKSEIDKLAFCALARGMTAITRETVREVTSTTPESDTFALSNALIERNKQGAYHALLEMKARRIDPLIIIGMLEKSYSELVNVLHLSEGGMGAQDIADSTGINQYRVKLYLASAKKFSAARATRILSELVRVDTGSKWGGLIGYTPIEIFIAKCV